MLTTPKYPQITPADVFVHLAHGLKSRVTVVTPNRRLSHSLKRDFDAFQIESGREVWDTADILPISAFIERTYQEAVYSGEVTGLPALINASQEQVIWEDAVRRSGIDLLAVAETAKAASDAWKMAHSWQMLPQIKSFPVNEDGRAFREWSKYYLRTTQLKNQIDSSRLCDQVSQLCRDSKFQPPLTLICYGFDIVTPQQITLLNTIEGTGCQILIGRSYSQMRLHHGRVERVSCIDSGDEILRSAIWSRSRIENHPSARIGIVVPDLANRRSAILRTFGSVMNPDVSHLMSEDDQVRMPFNISLGSPLTDHPIVSTAILILEMIGREIDFERASILLRSPFIAGAEVEMTGRARLDSELRRYADPVMNFDQLQGMIDREGSYCPVLRGCLSDLSKLRHECVTGSSSPSLVAKTLSNLLQAAGFPGDRPLNSFEYQALKRWHELLSEFASLDRVITRIRYGESVSRLRRMAAGTLFQPETDDAPVQILGVFEAAGMEFDHLWVMGLSDDVWPQPARTNPFLPIELQRSSRMPQASSDESLELARRITSDWLCNADEVVLSHPMSSPVRGGQDLMMSPLIKHISQGMAAEIQTTDYPSYREMVHRSGLIEYSLDIQPTVIDQDRYPIRGGTAVIKDQSLCNFRAMAVHRLGAQGLQSTHTGFDSRERGTMLHRVLSQLWKTVKSRQELLKISPDDLDALLRKFSTGAIDQIRRGRPQTLGKQFSEIETRRLMTLVRDWLEVDRSREDFTVIESEQSHQIEIGGLILKTRLDRVDEMSDGRRIVIDYKSRSPSVESLVGDRPEEPQIPLYLITTEPDAVAVAFAQVRRGDMQFTAIARDNDLLPGVKSLSESRLSDRYESWEDLINSWSERLTHLAESFYRGESEVNPIRRDLTCRYCDIQPLCRIYERSGDALPDQEELS